MALSETQMHRCALALMARVSLPELGEVDTQLSPPLSPADAAALKICFLRDITANISNIIDSGGAEGAIIFTPAGAESSLREIALKGFKLFRQRGRTLGDALANATEDLLNRGFPAVCLLNSNAPTVPRSLIEVAIETLSRPGERVVLGGVKGGGYYLIGLKQTHRDLLERISSGSANVVAHMTASAAKIGLKLEMLPPWYEVVDAPTLRRLNEELLEASRQPAGSARRDKAHSAPYTRQFLAKLLETEAGSRILQGDDF
jgi:uncharacterized protein